LNDSIKYLYRALRKVEIEQGNILIPKGQSPFKQHPRLGVDTRLPFKLAPTEEHAVRQHQWKQRGFPTSGVSTTPHLERATYYAQENKVIAKINRLLLSQYHVAEYVVKEYLGSHPQDIACPEDDEVILVKSDGNVFPKEIIEEVIRL
jgi:hypothetical protein